MRSIIIRPLSLFFLCLVATPYFYFGYQQNRQHEIRHEMKEKLEQSMLQTVTIHEDDLNWAEQGKEIWIQGRLFDIKSIVRSGNQFICNGLYDYEETALVKIVREKQQQENGTKSNLVSKLFQVFSWLPDLESNLFYFAPVYKSKFSLAAISIISRYNKVATPPPKS